MERATTSNYCYILSEVDLEKTSPPLRMPTTTIEDTTTDADGRTSTTRRQEHSSGLKRTQPVVANCENSEEGHVPTVTPEKYKGHEPVLGNR